jgi:acyl-CoA synthetase (AMP-forming)/AMP-acid ligase II
MLDKSRSAYASLVDLLAARAAEQPNARAYVFLSDQGDEDSVLSFGELKRRAQGVAGHLIEGGNPGDRALLLFGPGLDFIIAYFGCILAGMLPVPMMVPRRNSSLDASASIVGDCNPRFIMTNARLNSARPDLRDRFGGAQMQWLLVDQDNLSSSRQMPALPRPTADAVAFLQYTSGSTSAPKGVRVTHGNLIANLEMLRVGFGNTRDSTYASWTPLYHDMGLISNVLQSLYLGSPCVLLSSATFIQRPLSWLRAIHRYRAEVSGGPNFAFDLCVRRFRAEQMQDIDLSCWKVAFNAAEPLRADTLERFAATYGPYGFNARAMYPSYGLAEATVLVSCGQRGAGPVIRTVGLAALRRNEIASPTAHDDRHRMVGCGRNIAGQRLAIVDPQTCRRLGADRIGEVWVAGDHVCKGYWHNAEATRSTFQARIAGEQEDETWLRTGDLGFMDEAGELFITGRIKDMMIVRGINYYPQDIENTVYNSHPALRPHCSAAFSVLTDESEEKVVVVQEVERSRGRIDVEDILASIREAVVNEHEIALDSIVLIPPGTIPKTTSGKIQRNQVRQMWLQHAFAAIE